MSDDGNARAVENVEFQWGVKRLSLLRQRARCENDLKIPGGRQFVREVFKTYVLHDIDAERIIQHARDTGKSTETAFAEEYQLRLNIVTQIMNRLSTTLLAAVNSEGAQFLKDHVGTPREIIARRLFATYVLQAMRVATWMFAPDHQHIAALRSRKGIALFESSFASFLRTLRTTTDETIADVGRVMQYAEAEYRSKADAYASIIPNQPGNTPEMERKFNIANAPAVGQRAGLLLRKRIKERLKQQQWWDQEFYDVHALFARYGALEQTLSRTTQALQYLLPKTRFFLATLRESGVEDDGGDLYTVDYRNVPWDNLWRVYAKQCLFTVFEAAVEPIEHIADEMIEPNRRNNILRIIRDIDQPLMQFPSVGVDRTQFRQREQALEQTVPLVGRTPIREEPDKGTPLYLVQKYQGSTNARLKAQLR